MSDPYYPFYPGDYLRDTRGLTHGEHGAYILLLCEYYTTGPLPKDRDRIYRTVSAMTDMERGSVDNVLDKFFKENNDGKLHNKRADKEIEKRNAFIEDQTRKSKLGNKARWGNNDPRGDAHGDARGDARGCPPTIPLPSPSPSPYPKPSPKDINEGLHPHCPQKEIVDLYHEILPELPPVKKWPEHLQKILRARWREEPERQNLEWWKSYLQFVRQSVFLMGKKTDFQADLEWIIRPTNMAKILNGRYHKDHPLSGKFSDKTIKTIENLQEWIDEKSQKTG